MADYQLWRRFFHAGNFKSDGAGTSFDLIDTVLPTVGVKTIAAFGTDEQLKVLGDSIRSSGKFAGYKIVPHVPLPQEQAARYLNLMDPSVGTGIRDSLSPANCYAEMHVSFITAFRTNLSKMLMTGFVVRYFPEEPSGPATKIIHSKPQRGEERIGFSNFDFSSATVKPEERTAVSAAFKFMADRFLRKKVKP